MGLAALWHVRSSHTRPWTHGPALAGRFLTTGPPTTQPLTNQACRTLHLFFIYLKCLKFQDLTWWSDFSLNVLCTYAISVANSIVKSRQLSVQVRVSIFIARTKSIAWWFPEVYATFLEWMTLSDTGLQSQKALATWNMNLSQGLGMF